MNFLRHENSRFSELAAIIKTTPRTVDTIESLDSFRKKKALAMMADYVDLYPKLFSMGFRGSAILEELCNKHAISMMSFRNYIAREGVTLGRLKKLAAWSYRNKLATIADYQKKITEVGRDKKEVAKLQQELDEFKRINNLN